MSYHSIGSSDGSSTPSSSPGIGEDTSSSSETTSPTFGTDGSSDSSTDSELGPGSDGSSSSSEPSSSGIAPLSDIDGRAWLTYAEAVTALRDRHPTLDIGTFRGFANVSMGAPPNAHYAFNCSYFLYEADVDLTELGGGLTVMTGVFVIYCEVSLAGENWVLVTIDGVDGPQHLSLIHI